MDSKDGSMNLNIRKMMQQAMNSKVECEARQELLIQFMRDVAVCYKTLIKEGIEPEIAVGITTGYVQSLLLSTGVIEEEGFDEGEQE